MPDRDGTAGVTFARWVFRITGLYGLAVLLPTYLMEDQVAKEAPPYLPINHPEYYYGFAGVAVAWQVAFLIIAQDPKRFRPLMPAAMIEKFSFTAACVVLYLQQRISTFVLVMGFLDMVMGVLYVIAWRRTAPATADSTPPPAD